MFRCVLTPVRDYFLHCPLRFGSAALDTVHLPECFLHVMLLLLLLRQQHAKYVVNMHVFFNIYVFSRVRERR